MNTTDTYRHGDRFLLLGSGKFGVPMHHFFALFIFDAPPWGQKSNDGNKSNQNKNGQHNGLRDRERWLSLRRS
jgi:hypothetical protein